MTHVLHKNVHENLDRYERSLCYAREGLLPRCYIPGHRRHVINGYVVAGLCLWPNPDIAPTGIDPIER